MLLHGYVFLHGYLFTDRPGIMRNAVVSVASDSVSLSDPATECGRHMADLDRQTIVPCSAPMLGQWVQIKFLIYEALQLHEVTVAGYCPLD